MSNKWFRGRVESDSDVESDVSNSTAEDSGDEKASVEEEPAFKKEDSDEEKPKPKGISRFLKTATQDDSSENEGTKTHSTRVLSQRDKRLQDMKECVKAIRNHIRIKDHSELIDDFEKLVKCASKVAISGVDLPKLFLRGLAIVERFALDTDDKESRRTLTAQKAKASTILKQKVKKVTLKYDDELRKFKDNWDGDSEEEIDEEENNEGEEEEFVGVLSKKEKDAAEEKEKEWKTDLIERKIHELLAIRGRKSTDRNDILKEFKRILSHVPASLLNYRAQIMCYLVTASFDVTPRTATNMSAASWRSTYDNLSKLLSFCRMHPNVVLQEAENDLNESNSCKLEDGGCKVAIEGNFLTFVERLDDEYTRALQFTDPHMQEFISRLSDESYVMDALEQVLYYYTSKNMPKNCARVAGRILDHLYFRREDDHVKMLAKQRAIAEARKTKKKKEEGVDENDDSCKKEDFMCGVEKYEESVTKKGKKIHLHFLNNNLSDCICKCVALILRHGDDKAKARAILCKVYHLAIQNQFSQARDMILMSHLHETAANFSPSFQVLFNRVLAQLGMAAFRLGQFKDVHIALNELCGTQRVKELLAQGVPIQNKYQEKSIEQERQDKLKLCPFHMHINLDCLEAIHLVAAMLIEIPAIAANPFDTKRRISSKAFNKLLNHYESQVFLGPPENTKDLIYAASQALLKGDWKLCYGHIAKLTAWNLMSNGDEIKEMLCDKIKQEALRAFILQYAQFYDTISLKQLSETFQLTVNAVHAVVSKMIVGEELSGTWNQPAGCICVDKTHPTKLQHLCSVLAEKAQILVEYNERVLDSRSGFGNYKGNQETKTRQNELWGNFSKWGGNNLPGFRKYIQTTTNSTTQRINSRASAVAGNRLTQSNRQGK